VEPIQAGVSAGRAGRSITERVMRYDLYRWAQQAQARSAVMGWVARHKNLLGLDNKGVAKKVQVRPGAKIHPKAKGRVDDIMEHPDDYILTPDQKLAIEEVRK